ncbi:MAG: SGNH/GDSL hydrolase family protein [Treponema sp.]|jgi:lysophospholipase L1-like esterase|nr:SGNH/GDSL hydrolase family protein [Treponema sp.]
MKTYIREKSLVLFQGDSITDCGRARNDGTSLGEGYPARIAGLWQNLFPGSETRFLNRGVSGDRSGDLLERYEADFRDLEPDLVSILIGINDTWRRYDSGVPTPVETFEKNYRTLLVNLKRDLPRAFIVIIEPFLIDSDPAKALWREDLDPKIQTTRRLAKEFADVFIPMDGIFARCAVDGIRETDMSADGVHPAPRGHGIIAAEWVRALNTGISAL